MHRTSSVAVTRTLSPCRVLVIPPEALAGAIERTPELAQIEIRNVIAKEESIVESMAANFLRSPQERLVIYAKVLCRVMEVEPDEASWSRLPLALPAEVVGEIVNLNRVSVARQLSRWMQAGVVRREGRRLSFHQRLFDAVEDWIENRDPAPMP